VAWALLAVALASVAYFTWTDRTEYARFKALTDTRDRQARYRLWVAKSLAIFVGLSLAGLALLGRLEALWAFPAEAAPAAAAMPPIELEDEGGLLPGIVIGAMIAGAVLGAVLAARKKGDATKPPMLGDIEPLLPRNGAEIAHGALLSANAGLVEELFFRLYLPLLLVGIGLGPVAAFVAAGLIFGLAHLYQGWVGVLATTALGALLTAAYLVTQSLWVPILLHIVIDLNGLVIRPLATMLLRRARD
jgi:membrane protease YdiL (CAAX protease family)